MAVKIIPVTHKIQDHYLDYNQINIKQQNNITYLHKLLSQCHVSYTNIIKIAFLVSKRTVVKSSRCNVLMIKQRKYNLCNHNLLWFAILNGKIHIRISSSHHLILSQVYYMHYACCHSHTHKISL